MIYLPQRPHRFSAIFLFAVLSIAGTACAEGKPPVDAPGELAKIAKAYTIEIVVIKPTFPVKTAHGKIDGKGADKKDLDNYISLFASEFQLYPVEFVKRSKLKSVVLCGDLSFAGQRRNAIPDFEHDTLYLDVSRGAYSKPYLRKVIHHEYFHMIDYRDDGEVYKDEAWAALNPPSFKYGTGGKNAQELQNTSVLTDKYPGFLNHYSTTAVEEDKAELIANLIVDPGYVAGRTKKDRVLKAKVERMKELLATFCPDMNDRFWEKVAKAKRDDK